MRLWSPRKYWQQQADAYLSQINPVSTTLYEVLATKYNVSIKSVTTAITWATTQPTPIEVIVTIDGITITHALANPVTAVSYLLKPCKNFAVTAQEMVAMTGVTTQEIIPYVLYEGKSVRIQVRITWATTQPTPLVCRVKYAKLV